MQTNPKGSSVTFENKKGNTNILALASNRRSISNTAAKIRNQRQLRHCTVKEKRQENICSFRSKTLTVKEKKERNMRHINKGKFLPANKPKQNLAN